MCSSFPTIKGELLYICQIFQRFDQRPSSSRWTIILNSHNPIITSSYTRRLVSYQVTHDDLYRIKLHTTICRASSYTWWLGRIASSHIRLHDVRGIQIDWWIIADYLHSGQCKDENWRRNHVYQGAPTTRFGFKNVKQKHRNLARYLDVDYVTLFLKLWIFLCGVCYIISKVRDILM